MSSGDEHSAALSALPWRGPDGDRPELPLPPEKMPLRFAGGTRKRWRYVSAFGDELMICAASVQVGLASQTFWAILDRQTGELHEHTKMRLPGGRGEVWNQDSNGRPLEIGSDEHGAVNQVESEEIHAKLRIGEGTWQEVVCPATDGDARRYVWTRKRVAPVEVDVTLPGGKRIKASMRGVEDETAGYHPRHTAWSWSAGVGVAADGRAVGWNLVEGVNDPERGSERAIWVDGEPLPDEPGPVTFEGLDAIGFTDGSRLDFTAEAERARSENRLIVRYSYRQPFGTFSGSLDGIELASGLGVMESHDAVW